jgi:hypothetical protein
MPSLLNSMIRGTQRTRSKLYVPFTAALHCFSLVAKLAKHDRRVILATVQRGSLVVATVPQAPGRGRCGAKDAMYEYRT